MIPRTEAGLIRAHGLAALGMVLYTALLGLAVAIKFHAPEWLADIPWLTWGRLRYGHTQGVFFGWLGNAFLAVLYYAVPRLAERPVASRALGWVLFFVWNFLLVIPGWALVQAGFSQPLEWAEFPWPIDGVAVAALCLACVQFAWPLLRTRVLHLYVSGWYILGGLVFTLLAYPVGNFVPEVVAGAQGASYSGLWIHDAVGLFVTPLALAIAYIVIPMTTGRPIFSHFLSMLGFWLLFLVYPLNGTHHYVFSSIPMEAQKGAIVASVYLGVAVILVVMNQLLSLRGAAAQVAADVPLRCVWVGIVSYFVVSMQGSMQALMPVNRFVHFTDWVIGHAHLAMIGFASFTAIGGLLFVWSRMPGFRYNARAAEWAFWLLSVGLAVMVFDLTIAGLLQGHLWQSDAPWIDSVRASQPYWIVRSISGGAVVLAFLALGMSLLTGPRVVETAPVAEPIAGQQTAIPSDTVSDGQLAEEDEADEPAGLAWLRNAYVLTAVAGVGFFVFSFVVLAIWPNQVLQKQIAELRPAETQPLSAAEQRGRLIYGREGCVNCHTQLVRFTVEDVRRFGVASQAWETDNDLPQLWGTRRVGPDLAREHARKSRDWQFAHLYNPRHVVPDSMMPPYSWLFDGAATKPTAEARDLVAYLNSLGRNAQLAGLNGPQPLPGLDPDEEKRKGMFCDCMIPRTLGTAPVFSVSDLEPSERERFARRGSEVFARNCAGCHGEHGRGDGPAANSLLPRPRNLTTAEFSDQALSVTLWRGVTGSSMPGWNGLSTADLRGLVAHAQSLDEPNSRVVEPPLPEPDLTTARKLFSANCVVCHGVSGGGDGVSARNLAPQPASFRLQRSTAAYAEAAIAEGIPGTAMPAWKEKLSATNRQLLARYIRRLYHPESRE